MKARVLPLRGALRAALLALLIGAGAANLCAQSENITFADATVKNLCVTNWDTNNDGELSYAEAAAVTDLGTVFKEQHIITSFNELQYFTGLTAIGDEAFSFCPQLVSITLPNSITSIGNSAFWACLKLYFVEIPNSVTTIGTSAFQGCNSLTSVVIPNSVTSIGAYAFAFTISAMTSMRVLATTPPSCGEYAFDNVNKAIPVFIPAGTKAAYQAADEWKDFTNFIELSEFITFADANVKTLCVQNWDNNNDGELSYAEAAAVTNLWTVFKENTTITSFNELQYFTGLTSIGSMAFYYCTGLTSIEIPNSVTTIESSAFRNCSGLTSIEIPNSVTLISSGAFEGCTGLTSIEIPNSVTRISSSAFEGCTGLTSIEIPNSVTFIAAYAFEGCTGLTSIEIPNSVTLIAISAFNGCTGLSSIEIPNSVNNIGKEAFNNCTGLTSMRVLATTPPYCIENAFYNVDHTIPVFIPEGTKADYQAANEWKDFFNFIEPSDYITFADDNVKTLCVQNWDNNDGELSYAEAAAVTDLSTVFKENTTITSFNELQYFTGLSAIGDNAFDGCTKLASITIPNTITSIGYRAFYKCYDLTSVYYTGSVAQWCYIDFNNTHSAPFYAIATNSSKSVNLYINNAKVTDLVIPNTVTTIKAYAFAGYNGLTSVQIPNTVTTIESSAFRNCSGLPSIEIPNSVTSIGSAAFYQCAGLTSIEIPNSVTTIESNTFNRCTGLTSVQIPNSVTSIESQAFLYCNSLTSLEIPNSVTSIGNNAFSNCTGLQSITVLATTPPTLGNNYVFQNVSNTIPVYVPCGSREAYQNATGWSTFTNIQEDCETITLSITGYGNDTTTTEGWYLITSPLEGVSPENVGNMLSNNYDLYQFHGGFEGAEWRNYKNNENNGFTMLYAGDGYLYANSEDVTLEFIGSVLNLQEYSVYLIKNDDTRFGNWNLVGNPFTTEATVSKTDYYRIEPGTRTLMPSSGNVNPMEGIFVEANEDSELVTFTKLTRGERAIESPMVNIDLRNAEGRLLDRARLRMGEGNNLGKLDMLSDPNRLYFRIDGKDYAVARVNGQGEMPLHFDAAQNGTYSLNVNVEGMEMAYLHLIDNMTGEDIDLLATSTGSVAKYTFTGKPADYASRFRLVFDANGTNANNEAFAFIDAAGNIVINGEGTLQIVDVMGRVVVSVGGHTRCVPTTGIPAGVYVLRLINGNDVMTQKIVVE